MLLAGGNQLVGTGALQGVVSRGMLVELLRTRLGMQACAPLNPVCLRRCTLPVCRAVSETRNCLYLQVLKPSFPNLVTRMDTLKDASVVIAADSPELVRPLRTTTRPG